MQQNSNKATETITVAECRQLREVINTLTSAPVLTREEFTTFMVQAERVLERLEKENNFYF